MVQLAKELLKVSALFFFTMLKKTSISTHILLATTNERMLQLMLQVPIGYLFNLGLLLNELPRNFFFLIGIKYREFGRIDGRRAKINLFLELLLFFHDKYSN